MLYPRRPAPTPSSQSLSQRRTARKTPPQSPQQEPPVVALHPVPLRILEPLLRKQLKSDPATNAIRRNVVGRRERVNSRPPLRLTRNLNRKPHHHRSDPPPLKLRHHRPPHLVDLLALPLPDPKHPRPPPPSSAAPPHPPQPHPPPPTPPSQSPPACHGHPNAPLAAPPYSGISPCSRRLRRRSFRTAILNARISSPRVRPGSITSSMYPRSAAM